MLFALLLMRDINVFSQLIQVALGNREMLTRIPSAEEWEEAYELARKQAIAGIAFMGISRYVEITHKKLISVKGLEVSVDDEEFDESWLEAVNLSEELYYTWMQQAMDIQKRNRLMDERCVELQERLKEDGFNSCILKGQGVARLYKSQSDEKFEGFESKDKHEDTLTSNPSTLTHYRQSGDIDVWVFGGQEKVLSYITNTGKNSNWDYSHVEYNCFDDAAVEVHYRPSSVPNLFLNRKLQAFYSSYEKVGNMNDTHIESGIISTPTDEFNIVYILLHIYRHFIGGGIGLRQVMDYYFVLQTSSKVPSSKFQDVRKTIKELGLERFTGALLWVINEVFIGHSPNQTTLTPNLNIEPNEKEGRFLMNEIMRGGNFGKYDNRFKSGRKHSKINTIKKNLTHTFNIISHYPNECFWIPIWIVWHWCWKRYYSLRSKRLSAFGWLRVNC